MAEGLRVEVLKATSPGEENVYVGVDEAGRGSLVGDMFVGLVGLPASALEVLRRQGVRDSKQLTPDRRRRLLHAILARAVVAVLVRVPPSVIDSMNLNEATANAVSAAVAKALEVCVPQRIVVDKVGRGETIVNAIRRLGYSGEVIVEEGADRKYVEVSSASILAKVHRDEHIRELSRTYGDIGSGYPSDPHTIMWLKSILRRGEGLPPIVRRSWKTLRKIAPDLYVDKRGGLEHGHEPSG